MGNRATTRPNVLCTYSSALILIFKLVAKRVQRESSRPVKSKSTTVHQNGAPMASSHKHAVTSPSFVEKAIKEIDNVETLLVALVKMGLILAYFYVCDRTNLFMKENK